VINFCNGAQKADPAGCCSKELILRRGRAAETLAGACTIRKRRNTW
jgi:hypothetical protein